MLARVGIKLWGRIDGIKLHAVDANDSARAGHENRGRQRRRDFREGNAPAMPPAPPLLSDLFADDTRPLRLDLGCGLGAAARGWASDETRNVLGVDASRSLVQACKARAARDECGSNLAYVAADALSILAAAAAYPGPLEAISVQHPTPPNTRGALDWILAPDVVDAARSALAPGGVVAVETRSARAAAAAREGLAKAGFSLVPGAWPLPDGARSETGGACVALGWDVERLVFRVPLDDGAPVPAAQLTRRQSCSTVIAALAWLPRCAFAFDVSVGAATGDVLYPASLVGAWRCERVLTAVEGDQTAAEGAWRALGGGTTPFVAGRAETYETRFVAPAAAATYEFEGRDVAGVVLDRAFELNHRRGAGGGGAVSWDPRAPSILRDGDATLTVVSRTSEISEAGFGFDELVRVDAAAGGLIGGAARVSRLVRVKRRFRRAFAKDGRRVVEGLEIVKTYRVLDGVAEADLPTSSAKSTLRFERPLPV